MFAQVYGDNGKMKEYHYSGPVEHRFSPYSFNGGTVLAVAGEDFAIVASDTRLSEGYSIHSRDSPKCYKLTNTTVIGCSGFHGDCLTLTKIIDARLKMYKHSNNKSMTSEPSQPCCQLSCTVRRFFPYYVLQHHRWLDEEGKGAVYSFDPVGSYQRGHIQSWWPQRIGFKNMEGVQHLPLNQEKACAAGQDVFISAAERDVYTGDALRICIVTKEGIKEETVPLRKEAEQLISATISSYCFCLDFSYF
uniref:Proteasome subunit beta n=1 Tax=Oncorhynchus kisutch TaxID=8019 RepID=A0A8C7LCB2_ONCKI